LPFPSPAIFGALRYEAVFKAQNENLTQKNCFFSDNSKCNSKRWPGPTRKGRMASKVSRTAVRPPKRVNALSGSRLPPTQAFLLKTSTSPRVTANATKTLRLGNHASTYVTVRSTPALRAPVVHSRQRSGDRKFLNPAPRGVGQGRLDDLQGLAMAEE